MTDAKPTLYLSASTASRLVTRSARHAWRYHSRGGGEQDEASNLMRRGKLFDRLLFGVGDEVAIVDAKAWNTTLSKAARDLAEAERKIPVLKHKYEEAVATTDKLRALLLDRGIDVAHASAKCQHRVVWESAGVPCKAFLDICFVDETAGRIYDLKIVDDASTVRLDVRASIQAAAYPEAIETMHPELAGRVKMEFIIAEADGGDMRLAAPDGQALELGQARWRRAVATWGECLRTGVFPGYSRDVVRVEAKPWDLAAEMDAVIPAGGSPGVTF